MEINIKYQGYIDRQQRLVEGFRRMESKSIPSGIDYHIIKEISTEGREKLAKIRPRNLGQASRISGVSQGDLAILMVYIKRGLIPNRKHQGVL